MPDILDGWVMAQFQLRRGLFGYQGVSLFKEAWSLVCAVILGGGLAVLELS